MSSYKVKIADSGSKTVVIDINLPFVLSSATPDNPDSNWTTETSGLITPNIGRCDLPSGSSGGSTASSDGSSDGSGVAPASGDAALPAVSWAASDLRLCVATAPYGYGVVLTAFMGALTSNASGSGQLYSAFTVSGGLAAGAISWLQL